MASVVKICSCDGCGRRLLAKGLCSAHYQQAFGAGKPLTPVRVPQDLMTRLWARVEKLPGDGCWLWKGATNDQGYGVIGAGKKGVLAYVHIAVWEAEHGPIPDGQEVCHKCDTPPCVRHLFLDTHGGNMIDMAKKGRSGQRKLTPEQVQEIRAAKATESHAELALRFGVSKASVKDIIAGRNWAWLIPEKPLQLSPEEMEWAKAQADRLIPGERP